MIIDDMTLDQLRAYQADLQEQAARLNDQRKAVSAAIDAKARAAEFEADLAALRRKHGVDLQVIAPEGIAGAEVVGVPGAE